MAARYKIRCSLFGHQKDVRSVCPAYFPDGAVASGSRDVTAKIWAPNEGDNGFLDAHTMKGHSNFVSCVCMMPPDDTFPNGLVLTGSHDKTILAFTLDSTEPVYKLTEHSDTVCALAAGKFGSLLSGSWDKTAKVWLNQKCVMTLEGHEAAVWAVAIMPEGGFMLTGSADKTIKMWRAGKCEKTFRGHEDCVRGVAVLSDNEFLSCGNDATIRRWLLSGECAHIYYGHNNFVYSIAIMPNGVDFVSGSEDRTLKVWNGGECVQTIAHPTESVWTVCTLPSGDIVTGASDGVVRVFTAATDRMAPEFEQEAFEEQVAGSTIPAQVGDIPTDQLSGPEALFNPGKRDGQTMMVKDGTKIEAHQWNAAEGKWTKIGDVVGGSGSTDATSGKQLFEGKEYDYVFDVEIEEGKPPLKLPYNSGEDPWMAAHKFLERNDLSQSFLDQVANHITSQAKGVTLGEAAPPPSVCDPFTGGARYIPNSGASAGGNPPPQNSSDPFTGAGRYVPTYGQSATSQAAVGGGADPFTGASSYQPVGSQVSQPTENQYFPKKSYLYFESANTAAILGKLKEFNAKAGDQQVDENSLDQLQGVMNGNGASEEQLILLWKLLQWPAGILFPVLDVIRLAIRTEAVNQYFLNENDGPGFLEHLSKCLAVESPAANQMLVLRTLCNAFKQSNGQQMLLAQRDNILVAALNCKGCANKNVQIALSSLLLNFAVAYQKNTDIQAKAQILSALGSIAESQSEMEANFRLLVCLGTLVSGDANSAAVAVSCDLGPFVTKLKSVSDPVKVQECAKLVSDALH